MRRIALGVLALALAGGTAAQTPRPAPVQPEAAPPVAPRPPRDTPNFEFPPEPAPDLAPSTRAPPGPADPSAPPVPTPDDFARTWQEGDRAVVRALEKISTRLRDLELELDRAVQVGTLYVTLRACRFTPPDEPQGEAAAFLEIWEPEPGGSRWVFSGWMFRSNPALSAMDHRAYDLWLVSCSSEATRNASAAPPADQSAPR